MSAPNLRTSQGEDAIVDYIRGFNFALHTQLDLMRRFLGLHPKPPPDLEVWERRGAPEFAEQIDDFANSICEALGIYNVDMFGMDHMDSIDMDLDSFGRGSSSPAVSEVDSTFDARQSEKNNKGMLWPKDEAKGLCHINSKDAPTAKDIDRLRNMASIDLKARSGSDSSNGYQGSEPGSFEGVQSLSFTDYTLSPPMSPIRTKSNAWNDHNSNESDAGSVTEPRLIIEPEPNAAELPSSGRFLCRQKDGNCIKSLSASSASVSASVAARQRFLKNPEEQESMPLETELSDTPIALSSQTMGKRYRPRFHSVERSSERSRLSNDQVESQDRKNSRRLSVSSSDSRLSDSGMSQATTARNSRGSRRRSMRSGGGSMYWKQDMDETLEEIRRSWDSEGDSPTKLRRCPSGVLNPQWMGRLGWDIAVISLVLLDAMVLPFQMAYKDSDNPDGFDNFWLWLTTSFFACDMVINFFTAYEAGPRETDMEPGALVTRKTRIASNYLRSWFPIDFVSTIPWSQVTKLLQGGGGGGSSSAAQAAKLTKALKFIRFLRLMRMLRLAKLAVIWERVEQKMGSMLLSQLVALLRVMFMLISICHWNACLWWIIGKPENLFTDLMSEEAKVSYANMPHWTTLPRKRTPYEPEIWTWLEVPIQDAYIFCFYWTLGVMRTMPAEVTPVNKPERVYLMIFMFFAFSAFAISISQITQAFFKFSERKRVFNEDMSAMRMHLRSIKAPESLQVRVKAYSTFLFQRRRLLAKEQNLLNNLPIHLAERLKAARLAPHLQKLEVFRLLKGEAVQLVSELLADVRDLLPGDFVSVRGRCADAAWVRLSGRLSQVTMDGDAGMQQPTLNEWDQDAVDEACLTITSYLSGDTVMVTLCAELLRIDKKKFAAVRKKHPNFERLLRRANTVFEASYDPRGSSMVMGRDGSSLNKAPNRMEPEDRIADIGAIVSA